MSLSPDNDYKLAKPKPETVELINYLYEQGHTIIINTARGFVTGIDWKELTIEQFRKAGLKYHRLYFTKPAADFYIDDKNISIEEIRSMLNNKKL